MMFTFLPFHLQLFSNGMRESEQRHVTLRINASGMHSYHLFLLSESVHFMEIVNYWFGDLLLNDGCSFLTITSQL